jgi:paraquat-inducible protein A
MVLFQIMEETDNQKNIEGLIACDNCGLINQAGPVSVGERAVCARCGEVIQRYNPNSRARTAAFALAALCFYLPANLYPVLRMEYMARYSENTVWSGVVTLYRDGMWFVAGVVFCASILIPLLKLAGLLFLVIRWGPRWQRTRGWIHRVIGWLGPWAMLDVFLLAILVSLLKLKQIATVTPAPGIIAFAAVVVFTLLASSSYDARLIWEEN